MTAWVNDYVGIPYAVGGRDRNGLDCWGLLCVVFREQRGVELPDWHAERDAMRSTVRAISRGVADSMHDDLARRLDAPEPWAIVISERGIAAYHAGLCVGRHHVLHASRRGVVCPAAVAFNAEYGQRSYWRWGQN